MFDYFTLLVAMEYMYEEQILVFFFKPSNEVWE